METTIKQAHPVLDKLFPLIKYQFELPFSIKLLVDSAVCALLGKAIYEMGCPVYIKAGDSYEQFRHSQARATDVLADAFLKIMQGHDKGKIISGLQALSINFVQPLDPMTVEWSQSTTFQISGKHYSSSGPVVHVMREPLLAEPAFYVLRDVMDDSRRPARITCAVL